jgi:phospholipase C
MPLSFTGLIHLPRVKDRLATNFVPDSEFERDAANGTLPDFSLIEPNMLSGHSDYHPAFGRSLIPDNTNIPMDPPVIDRWRRGVPGQHLQHDQIGRVPGRL